MSKFLVFIMVVLYLILLFWLLFNGAYMKPIFIISSSLAITLSVVRAAMNIFTIKISEDVQKIYLAKINLPRCVISFIAGILGIIFSLYYFA